MVSRSWVCYDKQKLDQFVGLVATATHNTQGGGVMPAAGQVEPGREEAAAVVAVVVQAARGEAVSTRRSWLAG